MTTQLPLSSKTGSNFAVTHAGPFSQLDQYSFEVPGNSMKLSGKVFLNQILNLTSAEVSINSIPPGKSIPSFRLKGTATVIFNSVVGELRAGFVLS